MANKDQLMAVLTKLSTQAGVNMDAVSEAMMQLANADGFTRDENPEEHFCVMAVPVVASKGLIYMGQHIKAGGWIPPGGHIDKGEAPLASVKREFNEELSYKLTFEIIQLFDISIDDVSAGGADCKTHFNIWYLVQMATPEEFLYDTGEFEDAGWMTFEEAVEKGHPKAKDTLSKLVQ